jgi:hypothetical protein
MKMLDETTTDNTAAQDDTNADVSQEETKETTTDDTQEGGEDTELSSLSEEGEVKDGSEESAKEEEKEAAPEKYEPFDVSEGKDIGYKISPEQHEELSAMAKELGLTQPQVQKIVSFDMKRAIAAKQATEQAQEQAFKAEQAEWQKEVRKEYGDKLPAAELKAKDAYKRLVPEPLRKIFKHTGLDMHPDMFKMLVKLGDTIGEDTLVSDRSRTSCKARRYHR